MPPWARIEGACASISSSDAAIAAPTSFATRPLGVTARIRMNSESSAGAGQPATVDTSLTTKCTSTFGPIAGSAIAGSNVGARIASRRLTTRTSSTCAGWPATVSTASRLPTGAKGAGVMGRRTPALKLALTRVSLPLDVALDVPRVYPQLELVQLRSVAETEKGDGKGKPLGGKDAVKPPQLSYDSVSVFVCELLLVKPTARKCEFAHEIV
jgi:hypothetical protein